MNMLFIDTVGICGAALLLLAYFMGTTKRWDAHSLPYQLSNLGAAVALIVYSFHKTAYVHVGINIIWAAVAIVGLVLVVRHGSKKARRKR